MRRLVLLGLAGVVAGTGVAGADAVDPIALTVRAPKVARADRPVSARITVAADPGALDPTIGALRLRVRYARGECGGGYARTAGRVAYDRRLRPQPVAGRRYRIAVTARARPRGYGRMTVCAFLEQIPDERQYATNTDVSVSVTRRCTRAAQAVDRARRARPRRPATIRRLAAAARRACR